MAAIDDYVAAGFSYPKALALTSLVTPPFLDGGWPDIYTTRANLDKLVAAGFSVSQAEAIEAVYEGGDDIAAVVAQGIWAGTEAVTIDANM